MYDIIIEVRLEKYEINTRHRNVDTQMFLIFFRAHKKWCLHIQ